MTRHAQSEGFRWGLVSIPGGFRSLDFSLFLRKLHCLTNTTRKMPKNGPSCFLKPCQPGMDVSGTAPGQVTLRVTPAGSVGAACW